MQVKKRRQLKNCTSSYMLRVTQEKNKKEQSEMGK